MHSCGTVWHFSLCIECAMINQDKWHSHANAYHVFQLWKSREFFSLAILNYVICSCQSHSLSYLRNLIPFYSFLYEKLTGSQAK